MYEVHHRLVIKFLFGKRSAPINEGCERSVPAQRGNDDRPGHCRLTLATWKSGASSAALVVQKESGLEPPWMVLVGRGGRRPPGTEARILCNALRGAGSAPLPRRYGRNRRWKGRPSTTLWAAGRGLSTARALQYLQPLMKVRFYGTVN